MAFKYLISECYSRDMSMKTKSAKYAKMRRGEYQSVICPYGYQKSTNGRMEPDEEVSGIVRQTLRTQIHSALGVDTTKDKLDLQTVQEAEHGKKLRALQDSKRQLYEQYALGEIDLETYKSRKEELDAALVKEKNVHTAIAAQTKKAQSTYEAKVKRDEIIQEIAGADSLTNSLVDLLIKKVYVFPENRIEIEYVTQDFFVTAEMGKEA